MKRLFLFSAPLLLSSVTARAALGPQPFIEQLLEQYRTMKAAPDHELSNEEKIQNDTIRKALLQKLDIDEIGRLSLEKHWTSLNEEQQAEFLQLLHTLIEDRSLKNIRGTSEDFHVEYEGVDKLQDSKALVKTVLEVKDDEFFVDFKLYPKGDTWMIYDVVIDDVSTIRNYKDQFNKIIAEEGFAKLLKTMRDKSLDSPQNRSGAGK